MILWVGESEYLDAPYRDEGEYVMPLTEEAVLPVAFGDWGDGKRLSPEAALCCTSRYAQRMALKGTGLNPQWQIGPVWDDMVLKAPASAMNSGVWHLHPTWESQRLAEYAPNLSRRSVVEQYMDGPQYQVDGFVLDGRDFVAVPIQQTWHGEYIAEYRSVKGEELPKVLQDAAIRAVRAVRLDNCPFCVELRFHEGAPRVVEINARFGEDPRLADVWDMDPVRLIEGVISHELSDNQQ